MMILIWVCCSHKASISYSAQVIIIGLVDNRFWVLKGIVHPKMKGPEKRKLIVEIKSLFFFLFFLFFCVHKKY